MERGAAVRAGACQFEGLAYQSTLESEQRTLSTRAIATVVVSKARSHRERVAMGHSQLISRRRMRSHTYGAMRDTSADEPAPGAVGFCRVTSTRVQPSPFAPQFPGRTMSYINHIIGSLANAYQCRGSFAVATTSIILHEVA